MLPVIKKVILIKTDDNAISWIVNSVDSKEFRVLYAKLSYYAYEKLYFERVKLQLDNILSGIQASFTSNLLA